MNEELEKIAQNMRRKERELWAGNPPRMGNGAVALMLDGYASRLEVALGLAPRPKCEAAATEREMAKGLSKKLDGNRAITGNAAALREALELCVREMCAYCRAEAAMTMPGKECFYGCEALRVAKAALDAPARNCDRFRTADEVSAYWGANVHAVPLHGDAYGMHIDGETYPTFLDWLFATAEGGEK